MSTSDIEILTHAERIFQSDVAGPFMGRADRLRLLELAKLGHSMASGDFEALQGIYGKLLTHMPPKYHPFFDFLKVKP